MRVRRARILIRCKTYPSPSAKHAETSCVAGVDTEGNFIRLFPVPFRLVADEQQFKKWQWIEARIEPAKADYRNESHKIWVDTIKCDPAPLSTSGDWRLRRQIIDRLPIFNSFTELDLARVSKGTTLGLLRPSRIIGLEITASANPDWTDEERRKLLQLQHQGNLFEETDARSVKTLRKVPFDFHYRYECAGPSGSVEIRHKISDWEAAALFWKLKRTYGENWREPFRQKIGVDLPSRDLIFLMGTVHRFPDQWLIVSLIYPPRPRGEREPELPF
jgi:hypothetical protein